jgi:hypothetical protein
MDLLLDALKITKDIEIDIIGGTPEDHQWLMQKAQKMNITSQLKCLTYIPYAKLYKHLLHYQYGLAMLEGIKIVDYLEAGLIPIIPKIATYTDIFDNDSVIYYQADNPYDLARTLSNLGNISVNI